MSDLILWLNGGRICFEILPPATNDLIWKGEAYQKMDRYLGDYDYIVNDNETISGVAFIVDADDPIFKNPSVTSAENVFVESGLISILLKNSRKFHIKTAQVMFTSVYENQRGVYALVLPDFEAVKDLESL